MKMKLGAMVSIILVVILTGAFITAKYATASETERDGRFIAYSNGTVLDTQTNLMWAAKDNGNDINWESAKTYCKKYRGGGYKNWRMPTQNELAGLFDKNKSYQIESKASVHLTALIRLTSKWVWASETKGSDAAYVTFSDGHRPMTSVLKTIGLRVIPVRSGK